MLLYIVLFACGAVVMSVEILASRILAPEFGDTLQVWGALIGTIIGALSLGYWLGGAAADKWPARRGLAYLTLAAGLLVAVGVYLTNPVNTWLYSMQMDETRAVWAKPLLSAAILYGAPATLLGAVSPYCVRLAARDLKHIGRSVGGFYAVSSLGSIVGTFLTSFWLVGEFPVRATIRAEGVLLVMLSVVVFVFGGREKGGRDQ
jgi:MFS family permease